MSALLVSHVTGGIPSHYLKDPNNFQLAELEYADPGLHKSGQVDMLLGGSLYPSIIRDGLERGIMNSVVAPNTVFGWIVKCPAPDSGPTRSVTYCHLVKVTIEEQLSRFWELEEISQKQFLSEEDKTYEQI